MNGYFSQMPTWAKGVIGVAATAIVVFAGYKAYTHFSKLSEDKDKKAVADESGDVVKELISKGQSPSWPASSYSATANTIQSLLSGCDTPNNEVKVANEVIKISKKPVDWHNLVKVFGNRDIDDCGVMTGKTNYELIGLLKEQLDTPLVGVKGATGKRYYGEPTLEMLTDYLKTLGISI